MLYCFKTHIYTVELRGLWEKAPQVAILPHWGPLECKMTVEEALRSLDGRSELRPGPTHLGDVLGSAPKAAFVWLASLPRATLQSKAWFGEDDAGSDVTIWRSERDGPHRLLVGRRWVERESWRRG